MRDIVGKCLIKDASKRPSAAQLLEHKFFKVSLHDWHCNQLFVGRLVQLNLQPSGSESTKRKIMYSAYVRTRQVALYMVFCAADSLPASFKAV